MTLSRMSKIALEVAMLLGDAVKEVNYAYDMADATIENMMDDRTRITLRSGEVFWIVVKEDE